MELFEPVITGSLTITGSLLVSGSISSTGGIVVSGSILSASFATTSSYSVTSSNSLTASSADNFVVRNNVTASNMLATGRITAQTLLVQTVTSSIVYSSGSNIFGNLPTDVQQFTGSLRVTGSGNHWFQTGCVGIGTTTPTSTLHVSQSGVNLATFEGATAAPYIQVKGTSTPYIQLVSGSTEVGYMQGSCTGLSLGWGNSSKVFVSGSGNVGIGTATPVFLLDISGSTSNSNGGTLRVMAGASDASLRFGATGSYSWIQAHGSKPLYINEIGNNTILNLTSGNVGIGTCSPYTTLDVRSSVSRAIGVTTTDFVTSTTGTVIWMGLGATTGNTYGRIQVASNGDTAAQALSINAAGGNVGIGTISPSAALVVQRCTNSGTGATFPRLEIANTLPTQGDGATTYNFADIRLSAGCGCVDMYLATSYAAGTWEPQGIISVSTNNPLVVKTNNTERMRIRCGGEVSFLPTSWNYSSPSTVYRNMDIGGGGWLYRDASDAYILSNAYYNSSGQNIAKYTASEGIGGITLIGGVFAWSSYIGSVTAGSAYSTVERMRITSTGVTCFGCAICAPTLGIGSSAGGYIRSSAGNLVQWHQMCAGSGTMNINLQGYGLAVSGNYPLTTFWVQAGLFPGQYNVLLNINVVANSGGNFTCAIVSATCVNGGIGALSITPYHSNTAPGTFCVVLGSSCTGTTVYWNAWGFAAST